MNGVLIKPVESVVLRADGSTFTEVLTKTVTVFSRAIPAKPLATMILVPFKPVPAQVVDYTLIGWMYDERPIYSEGWKFTIKQASMRMQFGRQRLDNMRAELDRGIDSYLRDTCPSAIATRTRRWPRFTIELDRREATNFDHDTQQAFLTRFRLLAVPR